MAFPAYSPRRCQIYRRFRFCKLGNPLQTGTARIYQIFPSGDNIERARRSGVTAIVQPGGSIRDDLVIEECDKDGMVMAFTGMRLFHH